MAPALFVLGASGFTLYPVAMAWACEKVERHQLVAMNQALLMSYTVGSLLGPTLTAMLMQNFSDNLFYHDCQRVVYLSADAAAQSRASSDAGGARLIFPAFAR
jgi:UMF2 family putative MFS family transporter